MERKQNKLAMIPLEDFKILPFDKKCNFITVFADYLVYRVEEDKKYYLYYLGGYFVEVCYSPYKNRVLGINAFNNCDELDPYLDLISLFELPV